MQKLIAPSAMCADFLHLADTVKAFEDNNIDLIHIDIMDGEFVPNYMLGTDFCKLLRSATDIPLDIHLMIERPEDKLSWFAPKAGEWISVHYESTPHIHRALGYIRDLGARPMVALNPGTPICVLENLLDLCDGVLLMTVNPGFAGQKLVPNALEKIAATRRFLDERGYSHIELEVDGNVSFDNARKMSDAGANIFVAGSSSVFKKDLTLAEGIAQLRESIE